MAELIRYYIGSLSDYLLRAVSVCVIMMCALIGFWTFVDGKYLFPVVTYWPGCFTVVQKQLHPGDDVKIRLVASKYRDLTGRVTWSAVSGQLGGMSIPFVPHDTSLLPGDRDIIVIAATLPKIMPPGRYHLSGIAKYEINPVQTLSLPMRSDEFEVLEVDR